MLDGMAAIRLVLADDHELVRAGLRLLFSQMDGLQVVGEASGGRELLPLVHRLRPDLVVTDLSMPDGDGLSAIEAVKGSLPDIKLIVISMYDTPDFVRRAVRGGADGYVLKGAPPFELEHAVRAVMRGSSYFSPQVAQRLLQTSEPAPEDVLTQRQIEILKQLARGHSAKEIAFELGLSPKTVDVHRAALMARLQIGDLASLTLYAVRHGLVDPQGQGARSGTARP
jgi:DNA-binding NarL/FixJ family response regulator